MLAKVLLGEITALLNTNQECPNLTLIAVASPTTMHVLAINAKIQPLLKRFELIR